MPLRRKPMTIERVQERIGNLRESAESKRRFAAMWAGMLALSVVGVQRVAEAEGDQFLGAGLAIAAVAASTGLSIHRGLQAVSYSQEAAALQGALVQHQLEHGTVFDQDASPKPQ